MAIVLVRHGETAGNARRFLQHPDTPLSERGLDQARRLAARLARGRVAAIVASDYARALTTAEHVRDASGAPLAIDVGLRERNFGDLRGRPYAHLDFDPFAQGYVPPRGESWEELHRRVDEVWERLHGRAAELEGDLVLVSHGLVLHSLVSRRLGVGPDLVVPGSFGNTAVTIVEPAPPWTVTVLGCVAHLGDAELREAGARA
jgi:2,3-bisphosphoglycerate-dependent phosphoglycerate mutase